MLYFKPYGSNYCCALTTIVFTSVLYKYITSYITRDIEYLDGCCCTAPNYTYLTEYRRRSVLVHELLSIVL